MGILNVTPDSFHDGGMYSQTAKAVARVTQMIAEGADIIDIGAQSTRPNASFLEASEEWNRLKKVLPAIRQTFPDAVLSIDTFWSEVAQKAIDEGVDIVNDVSSGTIDAAMFKTVANLQVPYVLMHMQGNPQNMQAKPSYENVTAQVMTKLSEGLRELRELGVNDIILDPGFGFGKSLEHNYTLLNDLDAFKIFELPILAGLSRKSMINKALHIKPQNAMNGTTTLNAFALDRGVNILRVHDVKEAKEVVNLYKMMIA